MALLKDEDRKQIKEIFKQLQNEVTLSFFTQEFECEYCKHSHELVDELEPLSDKINVATYDFVKDADKVSEFNIEYIPAIAISGKSDYKIRFYGVPGGYEFSSLINAIINASMNATALDDSTKEQLIFIDTPVKIQIFVTPTCPHCSGVVQIAHQMAIENPNIESIMIEATEFPELANKYNVYAVPKIVINDVVEFEGGILESQFLQKILSAVGIEPPKAEIAVLDLEDMPDIPIHVTDSDFDAIVNGYPLVLVDFWAEWCGPCHMVAPTVEALAKEHSGKLVCAKVDVDRNPETATNFDTLSIPTLILFKDGVEVERLVGAVPKLHFDEMLEAYL
ncbi:MAG TPA: thioredoxin [Methanosarcinaceae archaeon]|nr:thioredoxin [Methanosarcinaceae archaeon]